MQMQSQTEPKERERETKKKHSSGQDTRAQRRSSGLQYLVQYMFACAILKPKTDLHESPRYIQRDPPVCSQLTGNVQGGWAVT